MPSPEHECTINSQLEILSIPYYFVKTDDSRGARCGQSQWQYNHWKAKDANRHAERKKHRTVVLRWQNVERCRNSRKVYGWTEEYCRYLDYIASVDIFYVATWSERSRYDNKYSYAWNTCWTATRTDKTSTIFSTSISHACSQTTSRRKDE